MKNQQNWLITGASGLLGHDLCRQLISKGKNVAALKSTHQVGVKGAEEFCIDITDEASVKSIIKNRAPDVIVHAAGLTNVDECEKKPYLAHSIHVDGTRYIAEIAQECGVQLVYISTDHLWDGSQPMVDEEEPTNPINVYAKTKLEGELAALTVCSQSLSIRTNFFGPGRPWRTSFSDWILKSLVLKSEISMFADVYYTPISTKLLCQNINELVAKNAMGIFNVGGSERLSKYQFALRLAKAANYCADTVGQTSLSSHALKAPRPHDMSLDTEKVSAFLGRTMPSIDESISSLGLSKFSNI